MSPRLAALLAGIFLLLGLAGCGTDEKPDISSEWQGEFFGGQVSITFRLDGTFTQSVTGFLPALEPKSVEGTWSAAGEDYLLAPFLWVSARPSEDFSATVYSCSSLTDYRLTLSVVALVDETWGDWSLVDAATDGEYFHLDKVQER